MSLDINEFAPPLVQPSPSPLDVPRPNFFNTIIILCVADVIFLPLRLMETVMLGLVQEEFVFI